MLPNAWEMFKESAIKNVTTANSTSRKKDTGTVNSGTTVFTR